MTSEPREIVAYGPGDQQVFRPADYPWLTRVVVFARGGDAAPGDPGYALLELYDDQPEDGPTQ